MSFWVALSLGIQESQIIETVCDIRMAIAQQLSPQRQGLLIEGFGQLIAPLGVI